MAHSTIEYLDNPATHRAELEEYRGFAPLPEQKITVHAPCLLQGRKQIAQTFKVMPETVREWVKEGAPIFLVGKMWQVEYASLVHWLEVTKPAKKGMTWEDDQF